MFVRAANYVDKIIKGEAPANLRLFTPLLPNGLAELIWINNLEMILWQMPIWYVPSKGSNTIRRIFGVVMPLEFQKTVLKTVELPT